MVDEGRERMIERVEWHEGMLLSPQHFQLLDARIDQLMRRQLLRINPFGWGVWSCHFDPMQLALGRIQVMSLDAIMSDGTVLNYDATDPLQLPLELDLRQHAALLSGATVDLYVTLPGRHTLQASPTADDTIPNSRRFRSVAGPLVSDTVSGGDAVAVPRQVLHPSLAAGVRPTARYDVLRIATVRRSADVVVVDARLPASLRLADRGAIMARVSDIAVQMRAKAVFLARQLAASGPLVEAAYRCEVARRDRHDGGDRAGRDAAGTQRPSQQGLTDEPAPSMFASRDRLRCLTLALPQMEAILQTRDVHPHALFVVLAAVRGTLALLREDTVPGLLDRYDHDDPGKTLMPLIDDIDASLQEVNLRYREQRFALREGVYEAGYEAVYEAVLQHDLSDTCLIVASGTTPQGLAEWMANAVIGSTADMPALLSRRILGLPREWIDGASARIGGDRTDRAVFRIDARHGPLKAGTVLAVSRPRTGGQPFCDPSLVLFEDLLATRDGAPHEARANKPPPDDVVPPSMQERHGSAMEGGR